MGQPSVSVLMPTYRTTKWIRPSLRSLAAQSLRPAEIIVIDASTDRNHMALTDEAAAEHQGLVTVHRRPHRGSAASLNFGISIASGDYVAIADHDDVYATHRLAVTVELAERTGADLAGGQVTGGLGRWLRLAPSRFPTDADGIRRRVERGYDPLPHITMLIRRSSIERFGPYRELARAADLELMLRWAHQGAQIAVSPEVLAWYRLRREHLSVATQQRWMRQVAYAQQVAKLTDVGVSEYEAWLSEQPSGLARREAARRTMRLAARLAVGTVYRRGTTLDGVPLF
jgi:glycosyltransferase involved in cell wall biosynthesis